MDLTDTQQRFTDEYLVPLNGWQAAIRAGYSAKTARLEQGIERRPTVLGTTDTMVDVLDSRPGR